MRITLVEYMLNDGFVNAEVRVTTPLGQTAGNYLLNQSHGFLVIDGNRLRDGLYYYSLVVDGAVVDSKMMMVAR